MSTAYTTAGDCGLVNIATKTSEGPFTGLLIASKQSEGCVRSRIGQGGAGQTIRCRPPYQVSTPHICSCLMAICVCQVDSCMGCIPLQRGAILIGFLNLFGSLLQAFRLMRVLVEFELEVKQCEEARARRAPGLSFDDDPVLSDIYGISKDEMLSSCGKGSRLPLARSTVVIPLCLLCIYIILTALMIHGVRQERPKLIAPWLWWQLPFLVLGLLSTIGLPRVEVFFGQMVGLLIAMYLFIVVNSFYLKLLQQERNPSRVTVIAMARRRSDMTVSFPSPMKDEPPLPYHSYYLPPDGLQPPPYNLVNPHGTLPPRYQSVDPLVASGSSNTLGDPPPYPASTAPSLDNVTTGNSSPTTSNPASSSTDSSTPDTQEQEQEQKQEQEQETTVEESRSSPEAVGERVPLVVKLPTSQNN